MKLKYIIPSFMAVVAMLVGCNEKFEAAHLDDLRVSSSYIAISADGTYPAEFTISAKSDWQIKNVPDWLTFSPQSGSAGDTKVTITAPATTDSRVATVKIYCDGGIMDVVISQTAKKIEPVVISVAQALAIIKDNPGGSVARVKGIVCKIDEISPQYGNATYYISDDGTYGEGNWLEIYRGKWIDGANFATGDEFAVGDEMVVEGTIVDYKGTPEFSQGSSVVSINKSLISIVEVEMLNIPEGKGVTEFPLEGGFAKIIVSTKGDGFHLTIPAGAKGWLHIADFGPDYVTLEADANTEEARAASVILSTVADGTTYSCEQSFTQKGVAPAVTDVTVAEFLAAEVGDKEYRVKGVITELYPSDKQGKSFYVSDYTGTVLVYRAEGFIESGAKVGDVVSVVGKRGAYNNNPQMVSGVCEINISVNEVTLDEFLTKPDATDVYYKVTGVVDEIVNPTYGNLYLKSGDTRLYVYGCYPGWGATGDNRKNCLANKDITVGDELTVMGIKSTFNGSPQVNGGIYVSHKKANQ